MKITSKQVPVPPPKHDSYGLGFRPFENAPEFERARKEREEKSRNGRAGGPASSSVYR